MSTITIIDPVTRIEGHMKVEVDIDEAKRKVATAHCTGTLFRGFETILQGRDPWDATVITPRICGVCPVSHGMASAMALDQAQGGFPPPDARVMRNLVMGANFIQSHILHFYLLTLFDYVKGPEGSPWASAWDVDQRDGLADLTTPEHLQLALEARRRAHEMGANLSGKMPIPHTFIPGGVTSAPKRDRIDAFRAHLDGLAHFVQNVYIPDVEAVADVYSDYFDVGKFNRLMAYGAFDLDDSGDTKLFPRGRVYTKDPDNVRLLKLSKITESVARSWYDDSTDNLPPTAGATVPVDPQSKVEGYSWLKAPRYGGYSWEVGPLARMWVSGDYRHGVSVMDRHMARAQETLKIALAMGDWLDELTPGAKVYNRPDLPAAGEGLGLTEAPRGALGHWVKIENNKIKHYQIITPTCWNASPRDGNNRLGPMEKALKGTRVEDMQRPVEVLRIIHSYDPCLSCAVHVMQADGSPQVVWSGTGKADGC